MRIYILPYFGKLEAFHQVTGNNTVKLQSFVSNLAGLFEFFLLWKSKLYLYTSRIIIPVYVRLTLFLKYPNGIHVHDGPGIDSDQVNHNRSVIHLSSFQAFVVVFTYTWTTKISHASTGVWIKL